VRRLPTPAGRLATAIAVAAIRWLGFVPAQLEHAPVAGNNYALVAYGSWACYTRAGSPGPEFALYLE
jgi:hypothetical protein